MSFKKKLVSVLVVIGVIGAASAAFAFWTGGGSGSGSAAATTPTAVTVNQTGSITGLYPGAPATALSGNFDNPNSGAVHIANVTAAVRAFSLPAVANGKPACTAADFTIGGTATVNAQVPAGNGVGSWSGLTVALNNGVANQDNCKGVSITIDYTANAS
ncbi:MAG: hypothetical protein QOG87_3232 [Actinomycetota bacterium]|jgi:hypothetical protein